MTKLKWWQTQKLKLQQNSKTQIVTKLKNSDCDKLKLWHNSKSQNVTQLKKSNCDKTQKIKLRQNSNLDKTQKLHGPGRPLAAPSDSSLTFLACTFLLPCSISIWFKKLFKFFIHEVVHSPFFSLDCDLAPSFHFLVVGSSLDHSRWPLSLFPNLHVARKDSSNHRLSLITTLLTASLQQH